MRTVVLKLLLLVLPAVIAVFGFPFFVLAIGGELTPVSRVVERQATSRLGVLYGPSYTNPVRPLKLAALLRRAPDVAVLGTSRVLQFRAQMFRDPDRFYNAGAAAPTVWDLRSFLRDIPQDRQPKLLIVGLDQYLFNPNFAEFRKTAPATETSWVDIVQTSRWTVYGDYTSGKFTLSALFRENRNDVRLGLNAIINNNGFRNDGSYHYGKYLANPRDPANEDLDFRDTLTRIEKGDRRFEYGRRASPEAARELEAFLQLCRARGIHVVAFLPPFAHEVYARIMNLGDRYGYFRDLRSVLPAMFERYGYALFDFSDLQAVGASDLETIDGFHASERAYLRVLLEMQERDSVLRRYVADPAALRVRLRTSGPYNVFQ